MMDLSSIPINIVNNQFKQVTRYLELTNVIGFNLSMLVDIPTEILVLDDLAVPYQEVQNIFSQKT